MSSPAERYAAARERNKHERNPQARFPEEFAAGFDFPFDDFQREAISAVSDGKGVLVAAPTGAGKTIVGEFAVALALETGRKAFYTTPIKALSNQKYHDMVARHGADKVGLLTGDSSVNGEAPVVVMTTEVLRNMMYAGSHTLQGLGFVVMDEVHYLADRFRGAVWEEVIIHLPESVQVISLSATVSNAEEFGEWLREVRGNTDVIVSEIRPVPLWQHLMVGKDLYDLFVHEDDALVGDPSIPAQQTQINPELIDRIGSTQRDARWRRDDAGGPRGRRGRPHGRNEHGRQGRRDDNGRQSGRDRDRQYNHEGAGSLPGGTASRTEVIERLDREGLLPAITFIFSRAGCEGAVTQLLTRRIRLVTPEEGDRIRRLVEERVSEIDEQDLPVLGYHDFVEGLTRGFAAHHAGMLPLFREIVEELFTAGRIKAVFATETLALGINMPARTVVLEKLVKFNGEEHAPVTPAEYTQLTGRAGRRGIDIEGHAVVLHRRGLDPIDVAGLASTRTYPLKSSFRPTYNMAVNLVAQFGRQVAHELLQSSFAQFQADRSVVGLASQLRRNEEAMAGYAESMHCELGDFRDYARLRRELSDAEKTAVRRKAASRRAEIAVSLQDLTPGDVVSLPEGRRKGMALVLTAPSKPSREPEPSVLTSDGQLRRLTPGDLKEPVASIARLPIPRGFNPRSVRARKDLAAMLRTKVPFEPPSAPPQNGEPSDAEPSRDVGTAGEGRSSRHTDPDELRRRMRAHPCHACPKREDHARWAERWWQLRRQSDDLQRRVSGRTNTVAKTFDRICTLLSELGYLTEDGQQVTDAGTRLRRIYTEKDLVAAQALSQGTWKRLDAAGLAAVVSALIYEPRGSEDTITTRWPTVEVEEAFHEMVAIWSQLTDREAEHTLPMTGELDPGITWMVHRWASGRSLDEVLRDSEITAGDFVRRSKQVVDLLGQIGQAADDSVAATARRAADAMLRGVVAADRLD